MVVSADLCNWLAAPRPGIGIRTLDDGDTWQFTSYEEIAERVHHAAALLLDKGLAGARLALVAEGAVDFVVGFFAVQLVGGTVVPVVPRLPFEDPDVHRSRTEHLLSAATPALVLVSEGSNDDLPGWPTLEVPRRLPSRVVERVPHGPRTPALVQFSSGSTGPPRGIRIGFDALSTNIEAIRSWLGVVPQDATASWLPLYHDMGLIGCLLAPFVTQTELWLLTPLQFLRNPAAWLRCFGEAGCTITAAPPFGYAYAAKRTPPALLEHCDFSDWRIAIVGAEPVRKETLEGFAAAMAPFGFQADTFCPAYGLAESTLVVTGTPPARAHRSSSRPGVPRSAPLGRTVAQSGSLAQVDVVPCGVPVVGAEVGIRDEDGKPLPDGEVGEIWVGGASLAWGCEPSGGDDGFVDGWFRTGDVGFLTEGALYVLGRMADSFKHHGEMVPAEQAELAIAKALGTERVPVVVPSRAAGAGLTVLFEGASWDDERLRKAERAAAGLFDGMPVEVRLVPQGSVSRTTSGKPRRRACWQELVRTSSTPGTEADG